MGHGAQCSGDCHESDTAVKVRLQALPLCKIVECHKLLPDLVRQCTYSGVAPAEGWVLDSRDIDITGREILQLCKAT